MARRLAAMAIKDGGKGRKANYLNVVKHDAMGMPLPQWNGTVRCVHEALGDPLRWVKPRMVFVNSMSDLFHENVPLDYIIKVLAVCAICHQHTMQILTKRTKRMFEVVTMGDLGHRIYQQVQDWLDEGEQGFLGNQWDRVHAMAGEHVTGGRFELMAWKLPLANVWLGTSTEDQSTYDQRHPHIDKLTTAGWTTFLSIEPLLGEIVMNEDSSYCEWCGPAYTPLHCDDGFGGGDEFCADCAADDPDSISTIMGYGLGISWVIVGGESGHDARPCNIDHIRSIVEQCKQAGVACFVKQLGSKPYYVDEANKRCGGAVAVPVSAVAFGGWEHTGKMCKHPKGSDPFEWPADLRVREWPQIGGGA
jgi:protein gp37